MTHLTRRLCLGSMLVAAALPAVWAQAAWKVSVALGQQIVVGNLAGAAGLLAAQQGASAADRKGHSG